MTSKTFTYDVHGILTVVSDVALPELAAFRINVPVSDPTIRVRLGVVEEGGPLLPEPGVRTVTYKESPGQRGFAIRLTLGERIEIVASPFLRRSPHVLYTNAVEPVLRWAFVERGYALVHGACLSVNGQAFLITARTDTGKTTTVLKTLDAHPDYAFLSDDLTLLQEDGTVLPYPKPLTISRHTLQAVNTPLLTAKERFTLFFQSRLHSKSGRWFGLMLTRFNLPMATTNAIVQWMVPPPRACGSSGCPGQYTGSTAARARQTPRASRGNSTACLPLQPKTPSRSRWSRHPWSRSGPAGPGLPAKHAVSRPDATSCPATAGVAACADAPHAAAPAPAAPSIAETLWSRCSPRQLVIAHQKLVEMPRGEPGIAAPIQMLDLLLAVHRHTLARYPAQPAVQQARLTLRLIPPAPAPERPLADPKQVHRLQLIELARLITVQDTLEPDHSHTLKGFRPAHPRPRKVQDLPDRSCAP